MNTYKKPAIANYWFRSFLKEKYKV